MVSAQKPWYGASQSYFVFIFHNWKGIERRAWKKENKINLTSFCLLSTCSVSSWMTMTRHPLTTICIPLWINEYVNTLQNKRQIEELIQWNEKPVLPDKPQGLAAEVLNMTAFGEPHGYGGHVNMWQSVHAVSTVVACASSGQSFLHH